MGRVIPELSFSLFVPKAASCTKLDLEIKRKNSLTLFMSRRHRNKYSGTFPLPAACSLECSLAFCICRLEISGMSFWSSDWLNLSHMSKSIWIRVRLFSHSIYVYYRFYPNINRKSILGLSFDIWYSITSFHSGFSCDDAIAPKTRVVASSISFVYCFFVFSDILFQSQSRYHKNGSNLPH